MSFQIENGVLQNYAGIDARVVVPDGVTSIGDKAFYNCSNLSGITIPDGVTSIGDKAFFNCNNLLRITLPDSIISIGESAFYGCSRLMSITISGGATSSGDRAYLGFNDSMSISLPESLESIGKSAFSGVKLKSVAFKGRIPVFLKNSFPDRIQITFPTESLKTSNKLPAILLQYLEKLDDDVLSWLLAFQTGKEWKAYICENVRECGKVMLGAIEKWQNHNKKPSTANIKQIAELAKLWRAKLDKEAIESLIQFMDKASPQTVQELRKELAEEAHPIETFVEECIARYGIKEEAHKAVLWTVRYADSDRKCSEQALQFIISEYMSECEMDDMSYNGIIEGRIKKENLIHPDADRIAATLNRDDLSRLLESIINHGKLHYRVYMPVWGRFADEKYIKKETVSIYRNSDSRLRTRPIIYALLCSETLEAKLLYYRIGWADAYAKFHGIKESEYLDSMLDSLIQKGIHYVDRDELCSKEVLKDLIIKYETTAGTTVCDAADEIAAKLNRSELADFVKDILVRSNCSIGLRAWARFADNSSVEEVAHAHIFTSRGCPSFDEIGEKIYDALVISDTKAAMRLFDKYGHLGHYANRFKMSVQDVRDTLMMPEFGFEADGVKRYDIGGNIIEVSVTPELQLRLFDATKQKEIRSMPKKSNNTEKAQACAENYAAFKKEFQSFVKARTVLLRTLHMTGEKISKKLWHTVYCEHSVLRHITPLLVWQDDLGNTFMRIDGKNVDSSVREYEPVGDIHVAHIMNMKAEDASNWQRILVQRGIKQLFAQMWEPVINWTVAGLPTRYEGVVLSKQERSALKKALEQRGVEVKAEEMEKEWNHRMGRYEFSNSGALLFGNSLRVEYTVDPKDGKTTFKKANFQSGKKAVEMNAIIFEFDCASVRAHIRADKDTALHLEVLDRFTAAQISEFVNLAIDSKAARCTALLMDYKNEHYPEYADVNEFSLDW